MFRLLGLLRRQVLESVLRMASPRLREQLQALELELELELERPFVPLQRQPKGYSK